MVFSRLSFMLPMKKFCVSALAVFQCIFLKMPFSGKEFACNPVEAAGDESLVPWVRKMLWRTKWQPTPVFLPGEFRGRGSLVGFRLWGRTESDTTEAT